MTEATLLDNELAQPIDVRSTDTFKLSQQAPITILPIAGMPGKYLNYNVFDKNELPDWVIFETEEYRDRFGGCIALTREVEFTDGTTGKIKIRRGDRDSDWGLPETVEIEGAPYSVADYYSLFPDNIPHGVFYSPEYKALLAQEITTRLRLRQTLYGNNRATPTTAAGAGQRVDQ